LAGETLGKRAPGIPCSLSQDLFQSGPFKSGIIQPIATTVWPQSHARSLGPPYRGVGGEFDRRPTCEGP